MKQQWSFVKDPLIIAMWVVLAIAAIFVPLSIYQQQNSSNNEVKNATKPEFPIMKYHAPMIRQPDPETGIWLPVNEPQEERATT